MSKDIALGSEDIAFCQSIIRSKGNKITKFNFSRNADFLLGPLRNVVAHIWFHKISTSGN